MADLPNELVPVVKSMLGIYMDDITKFINADSNIPDDNESDVDVQGKSRNNDIQMVPKSRKVE